MTLKDFQLSGYTQTEAELRRVEKLIIEQYRLAGIGIKDRLKDLFLAMENVPKNDRYTWLISFDRKIKLKKDMRKIFTAYDMKVKSLVVESGYIAFSNNAYRQQYALSWVAPTAFQPINVLLSHYSVTGQEEAWKAISKKAKEKYLNPAIWPPSGTMTELFVKNRKATLDAMQRSINSGMMTGKSYANIAKDVTNIIGTTKGGKATGQVAKSMRIARTEGARLMNEGSFSNALDSADRGSELQRMWDATLDIHTREAHGTADGQLVEIDKPFKVWGESLMFPVDSAGSAKNTVHCRCTTMEIPYGIKPTKRNGRNPVTGKNEEMDYKDFAQWEKDNGLKRTKYGKMYKPK